MHLSNLLSRSERINQVKQCQKKKKTYFNNQIIGHLSSTILAQMMLPVSSICEFPTWLLMLLLPHRGLSWYCPQVPHCSQHFQASGWRTAPSTRTCTGCRSHSGASLELLPPPGYHLCWLSASPEEIKFMSRCLCETSRRYLNIIEWIDNAIWGKTSKRALADRFTTSWHDSVRISNYYTSGVLMHLK